MKNTNGREFDKENISQLFPWYATGKLKNDERLEVEKALARFPELRAQLALAREEITQTVNLNEAVAMPRAGATDRFMASLQKDARSHVIEKSPPIKRLLDWLALQSVGPARWAVAAGVLAVLIQPIAIGVLVTERQVGGFRTATGGTESPAGGSLVFVRISDSTTLASLNERLTSLGATIVDGPKAGGLFTLRIGPNDIPVADREMKIAALKASIDIFSFVGPAQ
jgi:hypothetical protein